VQRLGTAVTLVAECAVPFLGLGPRRLRQAAFGVLTGFQGLIGLTGNYGFFNWLTAILNLAFLEEHPDARRTSRERPVIRVLESLEAVAAGALLLLDLAELARRLRPALRVPEALDRVAGAIAPFHLVGSYGLFSVMTTSRPEIVIEGSEDGRSWREYEFRFKPGDVTRPPRWAAPHQPRLDWQMWFAALGSPPDWFPSFLARLLQGSPAVLALLRSNPFPAQPPRYVRAVLYQYRMADIAARRKTGACWIRTRIGVYFPACRLASATSPPKA
jgi:hypothetical protein